MGPLLGVHRARPGRAVQLGAQQVVVLARDVGLCVDHQPGDALLLVRQGAPQFAGVQGKALVGGDGADPGVELAKALGQRRRAGEHEVVGIARVARAKAVGQALQPKVQAKGAQIGQRRRGGRALRQVGRGEPFGGVEVQRLGFAQAFPHRHGGAGGAQLRQHPGHGFGVAPAAPEGADACRADAGKEVAQIE